MARVYAERTPLTQPEAAMPPPPGRKAAQKARWAARPLAERIALVKAGVAKLNEMKDAGGGRTGLADGPPHPLWWRELAA